MTTFLDGRVTIHLGDVRENLRSLPSDHFDCVVTSPPYWGLRDYGVDGQIGLEPTLGEHLAVMVDVFEEVRRVLKPTGTLWLNYGDCYATAPNGRSAADTKAAGNDDRTFRDKPFSTVGPIYRGGPPSNKSTLRGNGHVGGGPKLKGLAPVAINRSKRTARGGGRWGGGNNSDATLKPKDLCMIPNRLAIALQEAGWWVRSEIIWHKPNPMPESIKDRPGTSHEKVWMLSKAQRYFYDHKAVAEPAAYVGVSGQDANGFKNPLRFDGKMAESVKQDGPGRRHAGFNARWDAAEERGECSETRNLRNVWTIATAAFSEAHFATFPPELAERCIKAGCPVGGHVLDPFGGSGTTAMVAVSLGRTASLIELNPEYATLAQTRIEAAFMGKEEGQRHMVKKLGKLAVDPGPLFDAIR